MKTLFVKAKQIAYTLGLVFSNTITTMHVCNQDESIHKF